MSLKTVGIKSRVVHKFKAKLCDYFREKRLAFRSSLCNIYIEKNTTQCAFLVCS